MTNTQQPEWIDHPKTYKQCPKCQKFELDTRLPRGFWVKHFLFWKAMKKYRCGSCGAEVYIEEK